MSSGPGILAIQELLLGTKLERTIKAKGQLKLWAIGRTDFNRIVQEHPDLGLALFQEMSRGLGASLEVNCA